MGLLFYCSHAALCAQTVASFPNFRMTNFIMTNERGLLLAAYTPSPSSCSPSSSPSLLFLLLFFLPLLPPPLLSLSEGTRRMLGYALSRRRVEGKVGEGGGQGEGDRGAGLLGGGGGWGGGGGEEGQHFLFPGKVFGAQKA